MGSSKKHKDKDREHKHKKRKRSRSRSKERSRRHKHDKEDRHEKSRRKRERRAKDQAPEAPAEGVPGLYQYEAPSGHWPPSNEVKYAPNDDGPSNSAGGGGESSLSIEQTNKLRAKLGLAPLNVGGEYGQNEASGSAATGMTADGVQLAIPPLQQAEDVHVPAINLSQLKKSDELRMKLSQMREKRRVNKMLGRVKTLGESDSEDDLMGMATWVKKSRKVDKEKKKAEKTAKLLEEMDEEFGVGDLVEEEFGGSKPKYTSKNLRGIKVEHSQEHFQEGKTVILTLKDKGILDDDFSDVLVNVNMRDDEHANENIENKKKKPEYQAYDDGDVDEFGMMKPKELLNKYDDEIDGKKMESFELGAGGKYDADHERRMLEVRSTLRQQGQALTLPAPALASEYYTQDEMSFNKVKKKVRKIRKKPKAVKADDLLRLDAGGYDHGSRGRTDELMLDVPPELPTYIPGLDLVEEGELPEDMEVEQPDFFEEPEILGPEEDLTGVEIEEDAARLDLELALNKTRKLKQKRNKIPGRTIAENIVVNPPEDMDEDDADDFVSDERAEKKTASKILLNSTSEFCRTLGEIPTFGQAGNRKEEEEDELLDFERELQAQRKAALEDPDNPTGWQSVAVVESEPVDIKEEDKVVLDEELVIDQGLAIALQLATAKGYLIEEDKKPAGASKSGKELEAQSYSIEDKRNDDLDEKFRKRERYGGGGAIMDFKEKETYKPIVKLEYVDDNGRNMTPKEAFRYLSHRFHGKGSGKKKTEKRSKKHDEEQLMKLMSSTDTPLGTVAMLQEKQKSEKSPYVVLSAGSKSLTAHTSLTK